MMLRFIVIADSHIRPASQEVDAYPSNAWLVRRNEAVVSLCNRIDASFVVHLGDIVHPLPVEESHATAIDLADEVYSKLVHPIHFVAGNHDVGDKPNAHVAVPSVAEENYPAFESAWGPAYSSFEEGSWHFVIVDSQILNSGLEREVRQREWLESDLARASEDGYRIFLFMHYPPFVRERFENEHYDNIGEPARSWLLDLCVQHSVEALFAGHVHGFLYNRHDTTDMYVAPSTGFVRPDYSELAAVAPTRENGRDDPPKLGVFIVEVTDAAHDVLPVRTFGSLDSGDGPRVPIATVLDSSWESPIGVTIRHGWMSVVDFPVAGLDEFSRKRIRNDAPLLALWEARIRDVRIPIADLDVPGGIQRVRDLSTRGMRFSVFSAGVPDARTMDIVCRASPWIHRWEVIADVDRLADAVNAASAMPRGGVRFAIAPIIALASGPSQIHHFVAAGWSPDHAIGSFADIDPAGVVDDLVFRVSERSDIDIDVERANLIGSNASRRAVVLVELPRASESMMFDDDHAVAARVEEAVRVAIEYPEVSIFLDSFMDHDRGYYPRHGLIDRAHNPRPALYRLIEVASENRL
jgi:3',5'-cyclic AMP phosphodiesterase CpdA